MMVSVFNLLPIAMRDFLLNISRLISSAVCEHALQRFNGVSFKQVVMSGITGPPFSHPVELCPSVGWCFLTAVHCCPLVLLSCHAYNAVYRLSAWSMQADIHLCFCFCLLLREGDKDKASEDWLLGAFMCDPYLHGLRVATHCMVKRKMGSTGKS